jgi:hypothetical protein
MISEHTQTTLTFNDDASESENSQEAKINSLEIENKTLKTSLEASESRVKKAEEIVGSLYLDVECLRNEIHVKDLQIASLKMQIAELSNIQISSPIELKKEEIGVHVKEVKRVISHSSKEKMTNDVDKVICKFCGEESFEYEIRHMMRLDGDWRCKNCRKYQGE